MEVLVLDIEGVAQKLAELATSHKVALLVDDATMELCYPLISHPEVDLLLVPTGEEGKSIEVVCHLWATLLELGFKRGDYLLTLGGGAISDLGGFVASTYMRGIKLVHLPTTLLAMVDASIGGKTGIDFGGVKNSVGTFYPAEAIWVSLAFLETLPQAELLSGCGELLKYNLLMGESKPLWSPEQELTPQVLAKAIQYKLDVVSKDPLDQGIRAKLNLGHTFGHAIEAYALEQETPIPHGVAVAAGIVVALYISYKQCGLVEQQLMAVAREVKASFPKLPFGCDAYDKLWTLALSDKKRAKEGQLSMVLLTEPGKTVIQTVERRQWEEAIDFYRDFMG